MIDHSKHELAGLLEQASAEIAARYTQIRGRSLEDPGTAGDEGEEVWAKLLRAWLPGHYHVTTKGRVLFANGEASQQFDVFILSPSYPNGLLEARTKLYLAAGVLAAFECKMTLRLAHVRQAVQRNAALQALCRADTAGTHHIVSGLLAHSHGVRSQDPARSVGEALSRADAKAVSDPRDCLDFLCVADLASWVMTRYPQEYHGDGAPGRVVVSYMGPVLDAASGHLAPATSLPIARFLTALLRRLSSTDSTLRAIGTYFLGAGLFGTGQGTVRYFDVAQMSSDLQQTTF